MREKDGRSRGFGYVTLDSHEAAECCLNEPQVVDGRVVDMKRAVPERVMGTSGAAHNTLLRPVGLMREPLSPLSPLGSGLTGVVDSVPNMVPSHPAIPDASMRVPCFSLPDATRSGDASMRVPPVPACWASSWAPALDCVQLLAAGSNMPWQPAAVAADHGLSASAPEFVPQFEPTANSAERAVSDEHSRPALGEITNKVNGADDARKAKATKPEKQGSLAAFAGSENLGKKQPVLAKKKNLLGSLPQADNNAVFQDSIYVDYDPDDLVLAYGTLPGLPPMQTTKLPAPLALPGSTVAPPPGLEFPESPVHQPEEELSPVVQPMLSTTPTSVAMPPCAQELSGLDSSCVQSMACDNFSTTPTMAEVEKAETAQRIRFSREDLLRLRVVAAESQQGLFSTRRLDD
eukprot:TRINITY_DN6820_c0_g1_i2.p1 TRINITY_DN6820_c0_g1~~TRINITY_DN6820_c0_g1_i2.p1  ORF type:complete len:462 (+),score=105.43 TRINITY_DN6820_c0_g1_i2:175-1386(+)